MRLTNTPRPVAAIRWPRRIAAALTAAAALIALATTVRGLHGGLFDFRGAAGLRLWCSFTHVLIAGGVLVLAQLARGLWRGLRGAADVALLALFVVAAVGAERGSPAVAAGGLLGSAAVLLTRSRAFAARAGGSARWVGAGVATAGGAATAAFALALASSGVPAWSWHAARDAAERLVDGAWWLTSDSPASVALDVFAITVVGAATFALGAALRPRPTPVGHRADEHERAAAIVRRFAVDSLDPFALREDKCFHFAHGGLVAYRTVARTAVVAGDPIGPPGTAAAILADFEEAAARRGWDVVLTGASGRHLAGFRALGYRAMRIGEEAVVDPATFSLDLPARKTLRKAVRRVARRGWTVEVVETGALDGPTLAEIGAAERAWRARRRRIHGFAMTLGRLWGAREDSAALYVLARDPSRRLLAFLRFAAYPRGLSLDAMRRLVDEPNGLTEALIVAALQHARAAGVREVSLNFAGFSHLMVPREDPGIGGRLARRALGQLHGRFQLDRLARFNERFDPEWRPRYLVWRGALSLPRLGLRVLQAEAYVDAPPAPPLPSRWRPRERPLPAR